MNITRLPLAKSVTILAGICCLFFAITSKTLASAEDQIDNALAASKQWVTKIDAGQYDDSYQFSCDAMRQKVSQDRWVLILKSLRSSWGTVVSRKQVSHIYKPNGYEGLEGECMVITYDTSFAKLDSAKEVVVLKWEDGKWLGAGYNAGAKPPPEDASAPVTSTDQTETHTETHATPQTQPQ